MRRPRDFSTCRFSTNMTVVDRLLREMKASPPKAGVLIVLTVVGMYFWIPPIWKAVAGGSGNLAAVEAESSHPDSSLPENPPSAVATSSSPKTRHWHQVEKIRSTDLLFQSAVLAEVNTAAFRAPEVPLPVVAETEQEPVISSEIENVESEEEQHRSAQVELDEVARQLSLRSIIIGPNRRAAVINNRVYSEGDVVAVAGRRARIKTVEARRVQVEMNGESVELRIDPFASSQVRLDR